MSPSILLLGATGTIRSKISLQLSLHANNFARVAFLTALADTGPSKEQKYASVPLERVVGSLTDPSSYTGFDIVIFAVGDDLCGKQIQFVDAAVEGGVRHFYPAEFGADLTHPLAPTEPYFTEKLRVRAYIESLVEKDASLGYTYVLNGIFADLLLQKNILSVSEDKKSAEFIGLPETLVTTTHSDTVAEVIVTYLLPSHLTSLSGPRIVRYSGSTMPLSVLYDTIAQVTKTELAVRYVSKEESFDREKALHASGNAWMATFVSAIRSIGFGASGIVPNDNAEYKEVRRREWRAIV
ncbi:hypothetical protein M409DRAFT_23124 [Zasmidium cellare ATCC 36951]|uniref:NmrA-like domain-containing protein n=1 Tax=Zasmidium cellare ATCC 36951 TaxID=1080233 RepID=A0A6A6CM19_ZASCE|nr:uncharacterized protein M409DRAFT_23124 [Zasmidium cellare ATCC 36951]KAF2166486.1 hypothetical protein M409DRAFT_23124 [Zasmidium cellare ATCC 36951]